MTENMTNINSSNNLKYPEYTMKYIHKHMNRNSYINNYNLCLCVLFYSSFVYTCVCVFLHIQVRCGSAVRFGQALPGFLITAPPFVCVPDVLGALARGFQTKKKNQSCDLFYPLVGDLLGSAIN